MKKKRYELIAGKSAKFWEVQTSGPSMTTTYGRIGTKGQSSTKEFSSAAEAKKAAEKLISQKTRKGYAEPGARNKTAGPITKSERDAKRLLAATTRLEAKYPDLQKLSTTIVAVRPRYKARLKKVAADQLNRKGSLIGGPPFLAKEYPAPLQHLEPATRSGKKIPMAPLLQIDLDDMSKITDEPLGTGLLQLWLRKDAWGSGSGCSDPIKESLIRIIPRQAVTKTQKLQELPQRPADAELADKLAQIDALRESNPDAYKEARESIINKYHYDEGVAGFDWTGSAYAGEFDTFEIKKTGAPLQIVGWEPDGYTIPADAEGIWYVEYDYMEYKPDELEHEADLATIREICDEYYHREILCSLFELHPEFEAVTYMVSGEPPFDRAPLWRPLIAFAGPLSDPGGYTQDKHAIFYRRIDNKLEYCHQYYRWNG